ncbi:MAG: hypothetical protein Q7T86_11790 [Hyphomicrobiaceae bacterium]|nr:hypothetical protein [Hyphomicrobiaceae bacterium]
MDIYDSDFSLETSNALDAAHNRRSANADFIYWQVFADGQRAHDLQGEAAGRPLVVLAAGPCVGFTTTTGPLIPYRDDECEGRYLLISIDDIQHHHGAVNLETVKHMSRQVFAAVREAFVRADGNADGFWATNDEMFLDAIVRVIYTSEE